MKKIAIIGKGILGASTAYFINKNSDNIHITIFDSGKGQATKAAAGIISPWLTKRRNKQWYHLARAGAALLPKIAKETNMPSDIYNQCGTIITRNKIEKIDELYRIGINRIKSAPAMKQLSYLNSNEVKDMIPILSYSLPGLLIKGGGKMDGFKFANYLLKQIPKKLLNIINCKATLISDQNIKYQDNTEKFDKIIVAGGAWIKTTLNQININPDIRGQKGQLIEIKIPNNNLKTSMPVLMPEGEYDFLPFSDGKLIMGATHEDNKKFDLQPTKKAKIKLLKSAQRLVSNLTINDVIKIKVGTRAYSSDYGPFFGIIPGHKNILMGGALGSSGLTTGPMIGKLLAKQILSKKRINFDYYEKPLSKYFK